MLGREVVPMGKLILDRSWQLPQLWDLTALEKSMADNGVRQYPLVDANYRVIDGLRQIEIMKRWGWDEAQVVKSTDLDFSLKVLHHRHHPGGLADDVCQPMTPRRMAQIYRGLHEQIKQRQVARRTLRNPNRPQETSPSRERIAEALGISSEARMSRSHIFFKNLEEATGDELAMLQGLVPGLDEGSITIFNADGAVNRWREERNLRLRAGDVASQRIAFDNSVAMLNGICATVADLRYLADGHKPAELAGWLAQLDTTRSILTTLSAAIRKKLP